MTSHFFDYQQRVLSILLGWGAGSMIVGALSLLRPGPFVRQFGLQALTWGAIDVALAWFGQRSAARKAARFEHGELDSADMIREARTLHRVLLINAGLDVGYIASGLWLLRGFPNRRDRQGMGASIVIQGTFLLLYDVALASHIRRRWIDER